MEERYLSLSEAADALDISERTAHRWIKSGKLRSYKPGRDHRIPESAIIEAIEAGEVHPKAEAPPSPEQPSFNGLLEEERRLHYLKPWAGYINALANRVEREIDQGHATDRNWAQEFNKDVLTLTFLYNRILPPPEGQTEDERLELLKLSEAIDRLHEVADKMHDAMEPIIAEMHKEMYAKEREQRKAALRVIHGRLSA